MRKSQIIPGSVNCIILFVTLLLFLLMPVTASDFDMTGIIPGAEMLSNETIGCYGTSFCDGNIVWSAIGGEDGINTPGYDRSYSLYMYNLSSGKMTVIKDNFSSRYMAEISGDNIVWRDERNKLITGDDIYCRELSSGYEFPVCTEYGDQVMPHISGNLILWSDFFGMRDEFSKLGLYDIESGNISYLEFKNLRPGNTAFYGDNIFFTSGDSAYVYNIISCELQRAGDVNKRLLYAAISEKYAIWSDYLYDVGRIGDYSLHIYNISDGFEKKVEFGEVQIWDMSTSGDLVAFTYGSSDQVYSEKGSDIYCYNITEERLFPVCTSSGNQRGPSVYDGKIVWLNNYPPDHGLYLTVLSPVNEEILDNVSLEQSGGISEDDAANEIPGFTIFCAFSSIAVILVLVLLVRN